MKQVLIITYYWPPSGGAGVQRWLKFAKYLPKFGWHPVIYTPKNPEYPVTDGSLFRDIPEEAVILKRKIFEPYQFYKIFVGQKKEEGIKAGFTRDEKAPNFKQDVSVWIRGNLFIPDARKFWVKPSVRYLKKYLRNNPVDAIISTGPPHSMHLIAYNLRKYFDIPWIADFRDPWTNIDFYQDLKLSPRADAKHRTLESGVIKSCDALVSIGNTMNNEFVAMGAKSAYVITNGYDQEDILNRKIDLDSEFTLTYIGTLTKNRNFDFFWKTISEICFENEEIGNVLKIKLIGQPDYSVHGSIKKHRLENKVEIIDYLPHNEVMEHMAASRVLLLFVNDAPNAKGVLTGKFFEYLASKRPILAIGPPDGDLAVILEETQSGDICDYDDNKNLKKIITRNYNVFKEQKALKSSVNIEQYSRGKLTEKLVGILNKF